MQCTACLQMPRLSRQLNLPTPSLLSCSAVLSLLRCSSIASTWCNLPPHFVLHTAGPHHHPVKEQPWHKPGGQHAGLHRLGQREEPGEQGLGPQGRVSA